MKTFAWLLSPLICLLPHFLVCAVFVDEAYQTDYHYSLLGFPQPHTTFFHRPSAASKASLLYTLSERNVVGAVNPKDGSIVWRQRLLDSASNQTTEGFLKAGEGEDTIISAVNDDIQAWDAADGRQVWGWKANGQVKGLEVLESHGKAKDVIALSAEGTKGVVRKLEATTGEVAWEYSDESGDVPSGLSSSTHNLYYISLHSALLKGNKIKVTALDGLTGKPKSVLPLDSDVTSEDLILFIGANTAAPLLIWTDKGFKTLNINIVGTKHVSSVNIAHSAGTPIKRIIVHAPQTGDGQAQFLVHYDAAEFHWAEVYNVDSVSGAVKKVYDLPQIGGKGAFSTSVQGTIVYFIRNTNTGVTLVSSTSSDVLGQWPVHSSRHGDLPNSQGVLHAVSEVVSRGGSQFAVRSALALPSGDWELVRNGELVWIRPEGLTGVVAAAWADIIETEKLAEELAVEGHSSVLVAYIHRVRRHARALKDLPAWIEALQKRIIGSFRGDESKPQDQGLHRDGFGFHKIVILATDQGRLLALDAGVQGKVIWDIKAVNMPVNGKWEVISIEVNDGTALVRGVEGEFLRVNTLTGNILQYQPGGIISSLKTSISVLDSSGDRVLIPVNKDGSLGDIPNVKLAIGTAIVTHGEDGVVRGWSFINGAKPRIAWEFTPMPGDKIASVTARPAHDPVASIGKALGDRNVIYKYLNPNLLLLVTVGVETSMATFYLLDSVSGAILYTATHSGVDTTRPIPALLSENWFTYSVFSDLVALTGEDTVGPAMKGYELVVSELYESELPNDRGSLGSSSNFSSIYPITSEDGGSIDTPHVLSQAYIIPGPISHMSVTSTLQGITPRSLLCTLPSQNGLIAIPRHILDPRRPIGRDPTPVELEEGLFKYVSVIEFEPKWILNHKREIISISNVITSPALLESTSLIFAFGDVDLFGTRNSPIGAFDMLGKGFSRFQLVGTVVALAIGTGLLAPMVRKKQIDGRWKA